MGKKRRLHLELGRHRVIMKYYFTPIGCAQRIHNVYWTKKESTKLSPSACLSTLYFPRIILLLSVRTFYPSFLHNRIFLKCSLELYPFSLLSFQVELVFVLQYSSSCGYFYFKQCLVYFFLNIPV